MGGYNVHNVGHTLYRPGHQDVALLTRINQIIHQSATADPGFTDCFVHFKLFICISLFLPKGLKGVKKCVLKQLLSSLHALSISDSKKIHFN